MLLLVSFNQKCAVMHGDLGQHNTLCPLVVGCTGYTYATRTYFNLLFAGDPRLPRCAMGVPDGAKVMVLLGHGAKAELTGVRAGRKSTKPSHAPFSKGIQLVFGSRFVGQASIIQLYWLQLLG